MQHFFLRTLGLALAVGALPLAASAQVGLGNPTPNPKAALDITATDKGLLIPRLTQAQRLAITSPPQGLMVYQTDGTASGGTQTGFWYYAGTPLYAYDGTAWVRLGADNLGNHLATQNLDLAANQLVGNGGSSGLAISSAGNVGIGTTAPTATLDVAGTLRATGGAVPTTLVQAASNNIYNTAGNVGQTFTLPANATITQVDLQRGGGTINNQTFALYAGVPTASTALASQTVSYVSGLNSVVLTTPLALTAAGTYSFATGTTSWNRSTANPYAGGSMYSGSTPVSGSDLVFTVYYTVPGSSVLYATSGSVGVGTETPTALLDVDGSTRLRGLSTAGVVTTDASGNLSSVASSTLADNLGNHTATQDLALGGNDLKLNAGTDDNNKLTYDATTAGPVLTGATGGVLGYRTGGATTSVLQWATVSGNPRVGIGLASGVGPSRTLDVGGAVRLRSLSTAGVVTTDANGVLSSEANQTLSISGSTLSISGTGGNSVTLPSGGGAPSGTAGGALSGTYPNPSLADNAVTNAKVADDAIGIAELSAIGTPSSSTYLRGDNSWATIPSSSGWSLSGNATDGNQFIGTTNDQDFVVKRNNNEAFRVYGNGRISLGNNSAASSSVLLGFNAGATQSTAFYNVVVGARAGEQINANNSTFVGYGAGQQTTGGSNTLLGFYAGNKLTSGTNNVFIGNTAAYNGSVSITGNNNLVIGTSAGSNLTSNSNNILLGGSSQADAGLYDAYAIGVNANVTQGNSLVIGNTRGSNDAVSVGIGTSAPSSSLQVNGTFAVGVVNNWGGGSSGGPNGLDQGGINNTAFVGSFYELAPSSGSQYYRLPTASGCPGRIYYLRFNGSTAPVITSGSSNIYDADSSTGASSYTMSTSNRLITVISDGTDWYVSAP